VSSALRASEPRPGATPPQLTLITGGASSGKSSYALRAAAQHGPRVLFVATCEPRDAGMHEKVARHRAERPASWTTAERSAQVAAALVPGYDAAIVDCVTLLLSQQLVAGADEQAICAEIEQLGAARPGYPVYVVTNEVGLGVVPPSELGRRFAELQGRANQRLAARSECVVCLMAGIPLALKGQPWTC
jgi:adenosylcobinamide kinase/adenosylcobinamide-phosphate guanylyltransferase